MQQPRGKPADSRSSATAPTHCQHTSIFLPSPHKFHQPHHTIKFHRTSIPLHHTSIMGSCCHRQFHISPLDSFVALPMSVTSSFFMDQKEWHSSVALSGPGRARTCAQTTQCNFLYLGTDAGKPTSDKRRISHQHAVISLSLPHYTLVQGWSSTTLGLMLKHRTTKHLGADGFGSLGGTWELRALESMGELEWHQNTISPRSRHPDGNYLREGLQGWWHSTTPTP